MIMSRGSRKRYLTEECRNGCAPWMRVRQASSDLFFLIASLLQGPPIKTTYPESVSHITKILSCSEPSEERRKLYFVGGVRRRRLGAHLQTVGFAPIRYVAGRWHRRPKEPKGRAWLRLWHDVYRFRTQLRFGLIRERSRRDFATIT